MDFGIDKFISIFVERQFPQFYLDEGPNFVLFVKAYYEWLEESGNVIYHARNLQNYRDIDNTLEEFLVHFQRKYLYGIPFNIIVNKRYLLKHILDVYRAKGNIQAYKLLFKLVYNEEVEVYIPGFDLLKPSDGKWIEPRYIEVTNSTDLSRFVGKEIKGVQSGTIAVVESYIRDAFNKDIHHVLYITNISPRGSTFQFGEKVAISSEYNNSSSISVAPEIIGSLDGIRIVDGGYNFNVGDIVKIAPKSFSNGQYVSYGRSGLLKVAEVSNSITGAIDFLLVGSGFGYTANSQIFTYKSGAGGTGASFSLGPLKNQSTLTYNTDLIIDYYNTRLDALQYNFPGDPLANLSSTILSSLTYATNIFGSIKSLTNIKVGNNYTTPLSIFVRSTQPYSAALEGTLSYSTSSTFITGVATIFDKVYKAGDVICLWADAGDTTTIEYQIVKNVISSTSIELYNSPKNTSTPTATYRAAPTILPSNFAYYEPPMSSSNNTINGMNELITANPLALTANVTTLVTAVDSGIGYMEGEQIIAYPYNSISNTVYISNGGIGYTNNDSIIFGGADSNSPAAASIVTDANGTITNVNITYTGSGYENVPVIRIKTNTGAGAELSTTLIDYDTQRGIIGLVTKTGVGRGRGYWLNTDSFLNSDKMIQDSYYYQDYSYELQTAMSLYKYKDIIYNTFHHAGNELFGKYLALFIEDATLKIKYEEPQANNINPYLRLFTCDNGIVLKDTTAIKYDSWYF
jgi:hypothetical protein